MACEQAKNIHFNATKMNWFFMYLFHGKRTID